MFPVLFSELRSGFRPLCLVFFFSRAMFECTLAFMVVLGIFSSCQDVSLFLVFFFGSTKKMVQRFWQCFWSFVGASGHGVLWFRFF